MKEIQPWPSVEPIWGIRNSDLKKAIQSTTLSLLNKEVYIRGMSKTEQKMMERSMREEWCLWCGRLTKNPSWICDDCI